MKGFSKDNERKFVYFNFSNKFWKKIRFIGWVLISLFISILRDFAPLLQKNWFCLYILWKNNIEIHHKKKKDSLSIFKKFHELNQKIIKDNVSWRIPWEMFLRKILFVSKTNKNFFDFRNTRSWKRKLKTYFVNGCFNKLRTVLLLKFLVKFKLSQYPKMHLLKNLGNMESFAFIKIAKTH